MLSASYGTVLKGKADQLFTGMSFSTGGAYGVVGGNVQSSGDAAGGDVGASLPGWTAGGGYGVKIYDAKNAQRNPQVFTDNNGNTLERCY